ncbi:MAG: hydroxymethylbilane synthase [Candidatus Dormiibacterota bacterium]
MSTVRTLRVGTRGSSLALVQAGRVASLLESAGHSVETVTIVTAGDRRAPGLSAGEGVFVTAIQEALLAGEVDLAVHSAKDLPTAQSERTSLLYPERADPRDALVTRSGAGLAGLPEGASVGTDSPRRAGFLRELRPDLRIGPLHGNVPTRLRKLDAGEVDALVLAVAGLRRLELDERIAATFETIDLPPAPAQAAIAVQMRAGDAEVSRRLAALDDPTIRLEVETERAVLAGMGGGCRFPLGALAEVEGETLHLVAGVPGRVLQRSAPALDGAVAALVSGVVRELQDRGPGGIR